MGGGGAIVCASFAEYAPVLNKPFKVGKFYGKQNVFIQTKTLLYLLNLNYIQLKTPTLYALYNVNCTSYLLYIFLQSQLFNKSVIIFTFGRSDNCEKNLEIWTVFCRTRPYNQSIYLHMSVAKTQKIGNILAKFHIFTNFPLLLQIFPLFSLRCSFLAHAAR